MAPQPDHLIERAAALLKSSGAVRLRDAPGEPPVAEAPPDASQVTPEALGLAPRVVPLPPASRVSQSDPAPDPSDVPEAESGALPTQDGLAAPKRFAIPPKARASAPAGDSAPVFTPVVMQVTADLVAPAPPLQFDAGPSGASHLPIISLETMERAGMVVARAARTRISEEYRIVIGRILRALRNDPESDHTQNVVMVTSARPGEGKSFTALNLAGSLAQHSAEQVLLVDVDAKPRSISAELGAGDRLGFHDLVSDPSLRVEDVILRTAISNLALLPVGTRSGEVSTTASAHPITPTVTRLSQRFPKHLILIDSPPCLSTSDPHTLAPYVGQVVMVIEAERTQRTEVEAALDLVRVCPTITILLNKVKLTTSHTFGAYDYYGSYS